MTSLCRMNYHVESEANVNKQINLELHASYIYNSIAFYFDRDDVALNGFHHFFKDKSDKERERAEQLMKYQNLRGGRILLRDIKKAERDEWGNGLEAMRVALSVDKQVNQSMLDLHKIAKTHTDPQMTDWIESTFLTCQVEMIKQIADHVTNLRRVGPGKGEYLFDRLTLGSS